MSSGRDLPYQLRPNKFIDRQIFLELIGRIIPHRKCGNYIYISMGGKHLVDHESIYRRLGIKNLFSFDGDQTTVDRQICNRPITDAKCVLMHSGSLAGEFDSIISQFSPASNLIVWLDYTRPSDRLSQLQELTECLRKSQPGDVFRITMNADDYTLKGDWKKDGFDQPSTYRAKRLQDQIGDFFPAEIVNIPENGIPLALARAVELACSKAEQGMRVRFTPVLLTSYADGARMFTATVYAHSSGEPVPAGILEWEFLPKSWSTVVPISVPDLSLREKAAIDRHLSKSPAQIIKAVKFAPSSEMDDAKDALLSYKKLHRFYPSFLPIGIQ